MPDDSIRQAVTDRVKLTEIISTPKPDIATMRNILENPSVGLLLMLPGVEEVVRINGKATLTEEPTLLADSAVTAAPLPWGSS